MTEEQQSQVQKPKKSIWKKWWLWLIIIIVVFFYFSLQGTKERVEEARDTSFSELSRARFDKIKENTPELDLIECHNNKCDSVVYFHFNEIPEDLDMLIRLNTATFSKFKIDNTGTSHVSIFAKYQNKTIFQCDGSKGMVDACK